MNVDAAQRARDLGQRSGADRPTSTATTTHCGRSRARRTA